MWGCAGKVRAAIAAGVELKQRFSTNRQGTVALIVALMILPLTAMAAVGVDYARAARVRSALQSATDAAVLAAARLGEVDETEIRDVANKFMAANSRTISDLRGMTLAINKTSTGVQIVADGYVFPHFLQIVGLERMEVGVTSTAEIDPGDIEIVLALDNTGSMRNYMGDLKTAASDLVNTMFDATRNSTKLRMAIVPYVGAVNIGNGGTQRGWMDNNADARWHGVSFEWHWVAMQSGCTLTPDEGGGGGGDDGGPGTGTGGGDRTGAVMPKNRSFANAVHSLLGISSAQASGGGPSVPSGFTTTLYRGCLFLQNPAKVNHFDLFDRIRNTSWKGCVEARAEPYDVTIDPPTGGNPDTLFVPYFWPDEPDQANPGVSRFPNDFIPDVNPPSGWSYDWEGGMHRNVWKYASNVNGTIVEMGPVTKGPNQACPDPIEPLTQSRSRLLNVISNLSHWDGSGTVSSEGLMWAWRVLSRDSGTFDQAKPKGEANKVIVLMTDGQNWAAEQPSWSSFTDYTAYGYLQWGRVAPTTYQGYKAYLDSRLQLACANAKADGVIIYTVTFGALDATTQAIYDACASQPSFHYSATTAAELVQAFREIGVKLTALRLSK
ncbi:MAG: pilus assembly protein TadG-related protein [Hyphomicrobiaceae bacterium]